VLCDTHTCAPSAYLAGRSALWLRLAFELCHQVSQIPESRPVTPHYAQNLFISWEQNTVLSAAREVTDIPVCDGHCQVDPGSRVSDCEV
jgi:hypothetical protein